VGWQYILALGFFASFFCQEKNEVFASLKRSDDEIASSVS
jgi:hypothetical protein